MKLQLKFKNMDKYGHPVFTTHLVPEAKSTEETLKAMAKKLKKYSWNPIYISEKHGTALVTVRNTDLKKLLPGAVYEVKLSVRIVEKKHANVWVDNRPLLISRPELGEEIKFDGDDGDESDDDDC